MEYKSYSNIEQEILNFNGTAKEIGSDSSGDYKMYTYYIGNPNNPKIYIMASMHGSEWYSTIFTMEFLKQLKNNTFIDRKFNAEVLARYCIVLLPVANPWGYDRKIYETSTGEQSNQDFNVWNLSETRAIRDSVNSEKPFAFLDMHLMSPNLTEHEFVFSYGHPKTRFLMKNVADSFTAKTGHPCNFWINHSNPNTTTNSRFWAAGRQSPNTDVVISAITEISRFETFMNDEVMEYGLLQQYLFCKYAINYHKNNAIEFIGGG
jgi:predicted deacylase